MKPTLFNNPVIASLLKKIEKKIAPLDLTDTQIKEYKEVQKSREDFKKRESEFI